MGPVVLQFVTSLGHVIEFGLGSTSPPPSGTCPSPSGKKCLEQFWFRSDPPPSLDKVHINFFFLLDGFPKCFFPWWSQNKPTLVYILSILTFKNAYKNMNSHWFIFSKKKLKTFGTAQKLFFGTAKKVLVLIYFNPKCANVNMNSLWSILVHIVHILSLFDFSYKKIAL